MSTNSNQPNLKFIACMFHIPATEFDFIEETLKSYDIGRYLIGQEDVPYEHYHVVFEGTPEIYHAFSTKLKKKYELRGRASKGLPRQYGKLKEIDDIEKLLAYTVKDGNFRGNFSSADIEKFVENSFKKDDVRQFKKEVLTWVESLGDSYRSKNADGQDYYNVKKLRIQIIRYYRHNEIEFTKTKIQYILNYILQFSKDCRIRMTDDELDDYLFYN